ncbi:peroxisomal (S)-2-hydroxy-acid oxidase GLO2 [Aedes aegypti]|uniref:(S)-2-hydroxy-acid oxidase n=1 Tax=Aedes aegypti TaxID=7159 RepID=A0A1S4F8B2_AEDAE|nr:peroxisomal (S)-2-hydroxy-acid oxidase GLO2 [Aedes aegypti]
MSGLVSIEDFEDRAAASIPQEAFDYYQSGADDEQTRQLNRSSYERLRIRPRMLQNVSNRDMKVKLFGEEYAMPIGISPTAFQKMAHPEGEVANARAAANRKLLFTLSTLSNSSIEEVADAVPKSPKWFQLYIYKERKLTERIVQRAKKAGFKAIVVTVDSPLFGKRRADIRNRFSLPPGLKAANLEGEQAIIQGKDGSGLSQYGEQQLDPSLVWDDIRWLIKISELPVLVKGILTKEDAEIAVSKGVSGIWVSNHGGRQLDSAPATIEVLPEIVAAVGDQTTIIVDGGVRNGKDVFKALGLGANMVMIGRPALWGLAVNGQQGVEQVLDILRDELDTTMALAGCQRVADITRLHVIHEEYYKELNMKQTQVLLDMQSKDKRKGWLKGIF